MIPGDDELDQLELRLFVKIYCTIGWIRSKIICRYVLLFKYYIALRKCPPKERSWSGREPVVMEAKQLKQNRRIMEDRWSMSAVDSADRMQDFPRKSLTREESDASVR